MLIVTWPFVPCLTFSAKFSATPWIRWEVGTWCENTRLMGADCASASPREGRHASGNGAILQQVTSGNRHCYLPFFACLRYAIPLLCARRQAGRLQ